MPDADTSCKFSYAETTYFYNGLEDMSHTAKRRVDHTTAAITGTCCLIENTDESNCVEYAYCLKRSTKEDLLDKLEFSWNMERYTLNLDTRYNVFRLSPKFYEAFNSAEWLLLPQTSIIQRYYDSATEFPDIEDNSYKYTLIAHPKMCKIPIHRQAFCPPGSMSPPQATDFTHYAYPYDNFPVIESHIHPRFVICDSGSKLENDLLAWTRCHAMHKDVMEKVLFIWAAWKGAKPVDSFMKEKHDDDAPNISDDDSRKTAPRRINQRMRAKRRSTQEPESTDESTDESTSDYSDIEDDDSRNTAPRCISQRMRTKRRAEPESPNHNFDIEDDDSQKTAPRRIGQRTRSHGSKRRRLANDAVLLDAAALREFEQQTSPHADCKTTKDRSISDWLNQVDLPSNNTDKVKDVQTDAVAS